MAVCKKCGKGEPRLGGPGSLDWCKCKAKSATSSRANRQNTTIVTPALSVAEQLAVLAKLRKEGSLTEQEFQALKSRLISGGNS